MLFKVINNDKVKVLIEQDELNGFDPCELDENDENTRNTVAKLLIDIYNQTGVNFLNSKIVIETVRGLSQSYYVIITRLSVSDEAVENNENDGVDMYLFRIDGPEKVIDIANEFRKTNYTSLKHSEMYKYKNSYYLCLYFLSEAVNTKEFDLLLDNIGEHAKRCRWTILNESLLHEWGECISRNIIEKINSAAEI